MQDLQQIFGQHRRTTCLPGAPWKGLEIPSRALPLTRRKLSTFVAKFRSDLLQFKRQGETSRAKFLTLIFGRGEHSTNHTDFVVTGKTESLDLALYRCVKTVQRQEKNDSKTTGQKQSRNRPHVKRRGVKQSKKYLCQFSFHKTLIFYFFFPFYLSI